MGETTIVKKWPLGEDKTWCTKEILDEQGKTVGEIEVIRCSETDLQQVGVFGRSNTLDSNVSSYSAVATTYNDILLMKAQRTVTPGYLSSGFSVQPKIMDAGGVKMYAGPTLDSYASPVGSGGPRGVYPGVGVSFDITGVVTRFVNWITKPGDNLED